MSEKLQKNNTNQALGTAIFFACSLLVAVCVHYVMNKTSMCGRTVHYVTSQPISAFFLVKREVKTNMAVPRDQIWTNKVINLYPLLHKYWY